MRVAGILLAGASVLGAYAYVPALSTNDTNAAIAGGLNVTDISKLHLQWYSNGSYSEHVSYQLVGHESQGVTKGVLVHFSEEMANNFTPPTSTPWIALVSCDSNATTASQEIDIFTLARDKGAVSALLYSLFSVACIINPEYADPATFDQVFDIFSTQSLTSAHLIEYQFGQLSPQKKNIIIGYNSSQLNDSYSDITQSVSLGYPVSAGYLLAVLQAYNATVGIDPSTTAGTSGGTAPTNTGSSNTALAMIVLYAITGCVSALFCIVIISGAIRAIRHPERYGPRTQGGEDGGPPQSRARGLTRAILDTFPTVKYGSAAGSQRAPSRGIGGKDLESSHDVALEMASVSHMARHPALEDPHTLNAKASGSNDSYRRESTEGNTNQHQLSSQPHGTDFTAVGSPRLRDNYEGSSRDSPSVAQNRTEHDDVVPASIGRDTCPICIVDFEEGDDIRVLPCEGNHCFHQECVDPWLLKLSSSCPICRHDFLALENMLSGESGDEGDHEELDHRASQPRALGTAGRFSRYLRFAHRRQRRRRGDEVDPTDPPMPTAPETTSYSGI